MPIENLRNFCVFRPPVVLFTIVASLIALFLMGLSIYIGYVDLRNIDVQQDWNSIFEKLSNFEFCSTTVASPTMKKKIVVDRHAPKQDFSNTHSVTMDVYIQFGNLSYIPFADLSFTTTLTGSQLGFHGPQCQESINVTLFMPSQRQLTTACLQQHPRYSLHSSPIGALSTSLSSTVACPHVTLALCVSFHSHSFTFPMVFQSIQCSSPSPTSTGTQFVVWHVVNTLLAPLHCRKTLLLRPHYNLNPRLTVMLSSEEKLRIISRLHACCVTLAMFLSLVWLGACLRGATKYQPPTPEPGTGVHRHSTASSCSHHSLDDAEGGSSTFHSQQVVLLSRKSTSVSNE